MKVPQIDSGSNTDYIYMYYNNASASAGLDPPNTYENNIEVAYHLNEDPSTTCDGTDEVCDSTTRNNYHMNALGTAAWTSSDSVNGAIGKAIDFDGVDQGMEHNNDHSNLPGGNNAFTVEGWFRTTQTGDTNRRAMISCR